MNGRRDYAWVFAVYLNARGFAFVIFTSSLSPYDWGVKETRGPRRHARSVAKLATIMDQYEPEILVLPDIFSQATSHARRIIELNRGVWSAPLHWMSRARPPRLASALWLRARRSLVAYPIVAWAKFGTIRLRESISV